VVGGQRHPSWAPLGGGWVYIDPPSPLAYWEAKHVALGDHRESPVGYLWPLPWGNSILTGKRGPYTHPHAYVHPPGPCCAWLCPARRFETAAAFSEGHLSPNWACGGADIYYIIRN
jgi:hypothetical protein